MHAGLAIVPVQEQLPFIRIRNTGQWNGPGRFSESIQEPSSEASLCYASNYSFKKKKKKKNSTELNVYNINMIEGTEH